MRILHAEILFYAFLAGVGSLVLWQTTGLQSRGDTIGPAAFPQAMGWALIGLCALGALRSVIQAAPDRLAIPGGRKVIVTLAALSGFVGLWQWLGHFYLLAFVFLTGLMAFYSLDERLTWRRLGLFSAGVGVFLAFTYLFFSRVLRAQF